jgi:hypothetical protein
MLNVLRIFDIADLNPLEKAKYAEKRHYFWFGEVALAAILAGTFAVPLGIFLAGRTDHTLAFTGAAICFLPLFIFLPKIIQWAMRTDADAVIKAFGKNEQGRKIFWVLFVAMAGIVLGAGVRPGDCAGDSGMIAGVG